MKATKFLLLFSVAAALASATSLSAVFNFTGLAENSTTAQIQSYMNGILSAAGCSTCTVTVSGAFADTTWNGDGHTVGPSTGTTSLTLANSNGVNSVNTNTSMNGTLDTFLATTNDAGSSTDTQITMTFSGMTINGNSSFDYEIFPDVSCTQLNSTHCGGAANGSGIYPNQPGFTFDINGSTSVTSFGTNGVQYGVTPGTTNGNATSSPTGSAVTGHNPETAPQFIGTWSGTLSSATQLDFIDWPATIGVDNISITFTPNTPSVPEPVSVLLLGTAVAGLALRKKFRKAA